MCIAVPGVIVEIGADRPDVAQVEVAGSRFPVRLGLQEPEALQPGDWVLVYAGYVLARIDETEARSALDLLAAMDQAAGEEWLTQNAGGTP